MVICDSNIISAYLQKDEVIVENILYHIGIDKVAITPIIFIELYRWLSLYKGIDKNQRLKYKKFINSLNILYLNEDISRLAMDVIIQHDSLEPADILIGTTGVYYYVPIYTRNLKHFKLIKGISLFQEQ